MKCFRDREWEDYSTFLLSLTARNKPLYQPENVMRLACEDCTLGYMFEQWSLENCEPTDVTVTPFARLYSPKADDEV